MLRYPEAPPLGRSRYGVHHPCGFTLASIQVRRPRHIPAGISHLRLGRAPDPHLASWNRLLIDPTMWAARADPKWHGLAGTALGLGGVPGVVPFAALFRASSCCVFPRRATHMPFSRTRPPREFCPGERLSRSIKGLRLDSRSRAWGWASGHSRRQAVPADGARTGRCCPGFCLFQVFGHEEPLAFLRAFSHAPAGSRHLGRSVGLWVPLPVASAHELGPWRGRSAACCRGQRLDQSGSR